VNSDVTDDELVIQFAGHGVDHDSAAHFRGRLDRRLLINRCSACGTWHQPPMPICPQCWSSDVRPTEVAGTGTIYLAVFLHQGPPAPGIDYTTPYPVVTVELDEQPGLRFTSTVIGVPNEDVVIGRRVRLDWVERGGVPLPVFRLEDDA
jgi:uncharacterized OB-fold protein